MSLTFFLLNVYKYNSIIKLLLTYKYQYQVYILNLYLIIYVTWAMKILFEQSFILITIITINYML